MSERVETVREQLRDLLQRAPFEPFMIVLENGDQVPVEHPENIAYDPEGNLSRLYVLSGRATFMGSLNAVTGVVKEANPEQPSSVI